MRNPITLQHRLPLTKMRISRKMALSLKATIKQQLTIQIQTIFQQRVTQIFIQTKKVANQETIQRKH